MLDQLIELGQQKTTTGKTGKIKADIEPEDWLQSLHFGNYRFRTERGDAFARQYRKSAAQLELTPARWSNKALIFCLSVMPYERTLGISVPIPGYVVNAIPKAWGTITENIKGN